MHGLTFIIRFHHLSLVNKCTHHLHNDHTRVTEQCILLLLAIVPLMSLLNLHIDNLDVISHNFVLASTDDQAQILGVGAAGAPFYFRRLKKQI